MVPEQEDRLESIAIAKLKGKGPPKKKKEKDSTSKVGNDGDVMLICACATSVQGKEEEVSQFIDFEQLRSIGQDICTTGVVGNYWRCWQLLYRMAYPDSIQRSL